jgi:hypothetical protein
MNSILGGAQGRPGSFWEEDKRVLLPEIGAQQLLGCPA